jgi:hypothetical protein
VSLSNRQGSLPDDKNNKKILKQHYEGQSIKKWLFANFN